MPSTTPSGTVSLPPEVTGLSHTEDLEARNRQLEAIVTYNAKRIQEMEERMRHYQQMIVEGSQNGSINIKSSNLMTTTSATTAAERKLGIAMETNVPSQQHPLLNSKLLNHCAQVLLPNASSGLQPAGLSFVHISPATSPESSPRLRAPPSSSEVSTALLEPHGQEDFLYPQRSQKRRSSNLNDIDLPHGTQFLDHKVAQTGESDTVSSDCYNRSHSAVKRGSGRSPKEPRRSDDTVTCMSMGMRNDMEPRGTSQVLTRRAAAAVAAKKEREKAAKTGGRKRSGSGGVGKRSERGKKKGLVAKCTVPKPGQTRYWNPSEHERFLIATRKYGEKAYVAISNFVGTRTPKQVRTHAQKYQMKMARLAKQNPQAVKAEAKPAFKPKQEARAADVIQESPAASRESSPVIPDPYLTYIGSSMESKEDEMDSCLAAQLTLSLEDQCDEANSVSDIIASESSSLIASERDDLEDLEGHCDFAFEPYNNPSESWLLPDPELTGTQTSRL